MENKNTKFISYYDIVPGSFPLFKAVEGITPKVILDDMKWNEPRLFSHNDPSVICVPTWQWDFTSCWDLAKFLSQKMQRGGYYTITGRRCDQETPYKSPDGKTEAYFSCFGMAYSPEPWIKNIHHWTDLEQNSGLPSWLIGWNPDIFIINHIKY